MTSSKPQAHENNHYREPDSPVTWKDLEAGMDRLREINQEIEKTLLSKLAIVTNPEVKAGLKKLIRQTRKFLKETSR